MALHRTDVDPAMFPRLRLAHTWPSTFETSFASQDTMWRRCPRRPPPPPAPRAQSRVMLAVVAALP
eukprot:6900145-Pyramimonas_sp.AAC.1